MNKFLENQIKQLRQKIAGYEKTKAESNNPVEKALMERKISGAQEAINDYRETINKQKRQNS